VAYVQEPYAARYKFTSALPAQLLRALVPTLLPLLNGERSCSVQGPGPSSAAHSAAEGDAGSGPGLQFR
jgi:hypothetical protein